MKKICLLAATIAAAATMQAQEIALTNGDFEAGVVHFPTGFDAPAADIPGWQNLDLPAHTWDSGVEGGAGIWWGTYNGGYSAFMKAGDGAFNLSDYTIQEGDAYVVSFVSKHWWQGESEWTVSLFYDDPANVIGTFAVTNTADWSEHSNAVAIAAIPASVGGKLGVSFMNSSSTADRFATLDAVTVTAIPEPSTVAMVIALCGAGLLFHRRKKS